MKTFTARELDRETTKVLDACDSQGVIRIRRRDGRSYTIRRDGVAAEEGSFAEWVAERRRRVKEIFRGQRPMTKREARQFDRMIAGE